MSTALAFIWDERALAMRVQPDFVRRARQQFKNGYGYVLDESQDRTPLEHRHLFKMIARAWENLPDTLVTEYPSPLALRKKALVRCGFYNEARIVHETALDARRTAIQAASDEPFALVSLRDTIVVVRTAKSQAEHRMKKDEFRASQDAILAFVSNLIGVDVTTLRKQAEAA